jgi:hypothetical protein
MMQYCMFVMPDLVQPVRAPTQAVNVRSGRGKGRTSGLYLTLERLRLTLPAEAYCLTEANCDY